MAQEAVIDGGARLAFARCWPDRLDAHVSAPASLISWQSGLS
jgi:hypothetical protein